MDPEREDTQRYIPDKMGAKVSPKIMVFLKNNPFATKLSASYFQGIYINMRPKQKKNWKFL